MRRTIQRLLVLLAAAGSVTHAQRPVPSHAVPPRDAPRIVARVNDVALTTDRLAIAIDSRLPIASYHRNLSDEKITQIRREALRTLIDEELQYQDAVRRHVRVTEAEVARGLARARRGYKSRQAWEASRRKAGVPLERLRTEIRRVLMIKKAYDQAVLGKCQVTVADAERFYGDNPDRFVMPEQRRVHLITIGVEPGGSPDAWQAARQLARDLRARLDEGESFEDLARRHSTDASRTRGGDLGFVHRGQMIDQIEVALDTLRPGDTSDVLQTIYGMHLVRVMEVRPAERKTFEQVRTRLRSDLQETRCATANEEWTAALRAAAHIVVLDDALR